MDEMTSSETMTDGCESTLLVMRHCNDFGSDTQDELGNNHCSYVGYERTFYLATLFGEDGDDNSTTASKKKWPTPSHLYALMFEQVGGFNYRQWETVKPLSDNTGIPITNIWFNDFTSVYAQQLTSGQLCGKVSVAVTKHKYIPVIATNLGCEQKQGCPPDAGLDEKDRVFGDSQFDKVLQLKFVYRPKVAEGNQTDTLNWNVYGAVSHQNFDPLHFSHKAGDYPLSGTSRGGQWRNFK